MTDRSTLDGRRVLLIVGGGIAAYKSLLIVRLLKEAGAEVTPVLTRAGAEFVTPLSLAALAEHKCHTDLFDLTDEVEMGHIALSRSADLLVVCPATANLLAKVANGHADDLASTLLLATDTPVLYAPAMNVRMWQHPATTRNVAQLTADGALFVGPEEGAMACGEHGPGRLAEPDALVGAIAAQLAGQRLPATPANDAPLAGRHVLVTAGPTHEPLDPVRYLANRSSGKQGYAIASAFAAAGARVTLVSGPTALPNPDRVTTIRVETAREMMAACEAALPADVAVMCAAVADYRPDIETDHKIKKERGGLTRIPLAENPDILATLSRLPAGERPGLVIGFAAETDDVVAHADAKRRRKGCDWIIANDVSPGTGTMGGDRNAVTILSDGGTEVWDDSPKSEIAARLARHVAAYLS